MAPETRRVRALSSRSNTPVPPCRDRQAIGPRSSRVVLGQPTFENNEQTGAVRPIPLRGRPTGVRLRRMPTPTFLVVGTARAGTTAVVEGLRTHPDVFIT